MPRCCIQWQGAVIGTVVVTCVKCDKFMKMNSYRVARLCSVVALPGLERTVMC